MNRSIGIFAHVDAGKTTFSEQILFCTQTIRKAGRVDHRDSYMDHHPIERSRGITVFSDQAAFTFRGNRWYLLDTPGHVDFSPEAERTMRVLDAAVLLIDGFEGVQSHTETLWQLLEMYHVPVLIFVNKMDRENADISRVIEGLQKKCAETCIFFDQDFQHATVNAALAERLAEADEELLESYLEEGNSEQFFSQVKDAVQKRRIFPVFAGSALQNHGVEACLDALDTLIVPVRASEEAPFIGEVYKVRHNEAGNRLTFMKVKQGKLKAQTLLAAAKDPEGGLQFEKVSGLYRVSGDRTETIPEAVPGDLCAVTGLTHLMPGDVTGTEEMQKADDFKLVPLLSAQVIYDQTINPRVVYEAFKCLEEEEPMLAVAWNDALQELQIHVMGLIQLEVIREIMAERFGLTVEFGKCTIVYKETIAGPVMGYGHFEPLRHYAEVHLRLEPGEPGSGIQFESECPVDMLDKNYQNLVRTHVFEREHKGVLTGSGLTDVKIILTAGKAHLKHTEGGDFRQATYRAIRQGLEKAESVLLEPVYRFKITVPLSYMGRVLSDIPMLSGRFDPPEQTAETACISGSGPVATMMDYSQTLTAFTKGEGRISLVFGGYAPCHNPEEVIAAIGYDRKRDVENTSDSVFCSHGAGINIPWDQVEEHLHVV